MAPAGSGSRHPLGASSLAALQAASVVSYLIFAMVNGLQINDLDQPQNA
jgi:hypothetical protein